MQTSASATGRVVRRPGETQRKAGTYQQGGQTFVFKKATQEDANAAVEQLKGEVSKVHGEELAYNWLNWLTKYAENQRGVYSFITVIGAWARASSVVKLTLKTVSHPARSTTLRLLVNDEYAERVYELLESGFFRTLEFGLYDETFEHQVMVKGEPLLEDGKPVYNQHLVLCSQFDYDKESRKAVPLSTIIGFAFEVITKINEEFQLRPPMEMLDYRQVHSDTESVHSYEHTESAFPTLSTNSTDGAAAADTTAPAPVAEPVVETVVPVAVTATPAPVAESVTVAPSSVSPAPVAEPVAPVSSVPVAPVSSVSTSVTAVAPVATTAPSHGVMTREMIEAQERKVAQLQKEYEREHRKLSAMVSIFNQQESLRVAMEQMSWAERTEEEA